MEILPRHSVNNVVFAMVTSSVNSPDLFINSWPIHLEIDSPWIVDATVTKYINISTIS